MVPRGKQCLHGRFRANCLLGATPKTQNRRRAPERKSEKLQTACRCLRLFGFYGAPKKKGVLNRTARGRAAKSLNGSGRETVGDPRADSREIQKDNAQQGGEFSFYRQRKSGCTNRQRGGSRNRRTEQLTGAARIL